MVVLPSGVKAMTISPEPTQSNLEKFQLLLRKLFQFDCAALDFGIYRIMNHKRNAIEQFISEQLPEWIDAALGQGALAQQTLAQEDLERIAEEVRSNLDEHAINEDGVLDASLAGWPVGQRYLEAQRQAGDGGRRREAVEARIYNHLYKFFSRYYEDGDFVSKRRYGRNNRYAIPYNGEEVHLHWANSDQYYVKSDEYFRNYDWKAANEVKVRFRLTNADVEQNNVKGKRRFFIALAAKTEWDAGGGAVTIPFEYRPLSDNENDALGKGNKQDALVKAAIAAVVEQLQDNRRALAALLGEGGADSPFARHLYKYVQRNSSDFFVHKDLGGFLHRELDFFLKNEVLSLDDLVSAGEDLSAGWFEEVRLTKAVGSRIIDFLAQIEGFQRMLWEKRKFVTEVRYCVRVGVIDQRFYTEIAVNDAQWEEWQELYGLDISDRTPSFLQANPTLMLDTHHFDVDFTDLLLASFSDLDGMTDGLLVHSENWQALRLLDEKYRGSVKCIYIDPPYNTNENTFLYKNSYRHSSWIAMISNRLELGRTLLATGGVLQVAINDTETHYLRSVLDILLGQDNRVATIAVEVNPAGQNLRPNTPALSHDYCHVYAAGIEQMEMLLRELTSDEEKAYTETDDRGPYLWDNLRRRGGNSRPSDRPGQEFPLYVTPSSVRVPNMQWDDAGNKWMVMEELSDGETELWPIDPRGEARIWRVNPDGARKGVEKGEIAVTTKAGRLEVVKKSYMPEGKKPKTLWKDPKYSATTHGTKLLNGILGKQSFSYPKSVYLVMDCLRFWMKKDDVVVDFFAGSGTTAHATINLNRQDAGRRKFVLVEMGDYFDTVLIPRIKKVVFSPEWSDGKTKRMATQEEAEYSPRIVKYIRLESYGDALDSIEFEHPSDQMELANTSTEYLLKYMLEWETKGSETLLNAAKLASPFSYRLLVHVHGEQKERTVDAAETFNYLLGLNARQRKVYIDNGRRYLVYRGETRERPGHTVAVIWRETEGWTDTDFERDSYFIAEESLAADAETVYVNGDSVIAGAKAIEPLFKARMFAGAVGSGGQGS